MDEMELQFHIIHDTSLQQYWLTIPEAVSTVVLLMGEGIVRNM
jgi:hypothetical protein